MRNVKPNFALTTVAAVLAGTFATDIHAADEEELINLTRPQSSLSIGAGYWSGDREQFGIFDDLRDDQAVLLLDGDIRQRDDATGTWMTGRFRDLGIDTRDAELRYDRQGNWGIGLDYYQMPRVAPYTVNTGATGLDSEVQSVPANPPYVPGTGRDLTLKTERKGGGIDFYKYLAPNLNFKVSVKNEEKDGTRHWGRGGQAEFAVEPIDSAIRQVETVLEYSGKQFQMTGGYYGSWYDNHNDLVTTFRDMGSEYYLSLPADNEAHQFFVNGGYNFSPTTRGTFRVSYTHATQDAHLPTADILGLAYSGAPTSLDGEINTTVVQLGLSAKPAENLNVIAKLSYREVDEQTPDWLVVCDVPCDGTTREVHSTPFDYETISGMLEGVYRLPKGYSLIGGIEHKTLDRTVPFGNDNNGDGSDDERYVPFRDDSDETTYRIQLRKSLSETLNGSLAFLRSKRGGSSYAEAVNSLGGINPVHIADRDRDKWRLNVDWVPMEALGLQFNFEDADDDYGPGKNPYGLRKGSYRLFSVDADYAINEDWHITGWASYDETKATQDNGQFSGGGALILDRSSDLRDTGKSVGLGVNGQATSNLKVGADIEWTRTKSEYDDNGVTAADYNSNSAGPLPDIESTATKIGFFAEYAVEKNADLRLDVVYEKWKTNDWTWQFFDGSPFIYGTSWDGTTVIQDDRQSATFVGVTYRYKF